MEHHNNRHRSTALRAGVVVALHGFLILWLTIPARAASPGVVDIGPVTISPEVVSPGQRPDIETQVSIAKKSKTRSVVVNIVAVVTQPDGRVKSWSWKTKISRESARSIAIPQEYDSSATGSYRVDIAVYSEDMKQRYALRSRSFNVVARQSQKPAKSPAGAGAAETAAVRETGQRGYAAVGLYGNVLNPAIGGTVYLWPSKYLGVQGLYSTGTFESYEGRLLAKYELSSKYSVYAGVGYVHVTADKDILGVPARFEDAGVSGAVGIEMALGKKVLLYIESSAVKIDLEQTVVSGGQTVIATVKYAPATIGCALVWTVF